jgi:hypothetical protein
MMSFLGHGAAPAPLQKEARRGNGAGLQGNPREYAASKGHTALRTNNQIRSGPSVGLLTQRKTLMPSPKVGGKTKTFRGKPE